MDPRLEPLNELQSRLESLVTLLGGEAAPSAEEMDRSWSAATAAFRRFRGIAESAPDGPPPAEVRERMEAVMRLDAVAVGLASRHRDQLAVELDKVAGSKSHLRSLDNARGESGLGGGCDVAG